MATGVGQRVRELRRKLGLSQLQLIKDLPLSPSYISLIEAGRRNPSQQVLTVLADRLGCTVDYLLTGRGGETADELALELRFAELALRSGEPQTARDRFESVRLRAENRGYDDERLAAHWGIARSEEALGNVVVAMESYEGLWNATVLPSGLSRTVVARRLCHAYRECGDVAAAIHVGEAALRAAAEDPADPDGQEEALLAATLIACHHDHGNLTRAQVLVDKVLAASERSGSPETRAAAHWNAALVAESRGDLATARRLTDRALALYAELDNTRAVASLRLNTAYLLLRSPAPDAARAVVLLESALVGLHEAGTATEIADAEAELARALLVQGRPEDALGIATRGVGRMAGTPSLPAVQARIVIGDAHTALGRRDLAATAYRSAHEELSALRPSRRAARLWLELARSQVTTGATGDALTSYERLAAAVGVFGPARAMRPGEPAIAARTGDRVSG